MSSISGDQGLETMTDYLVASSAKWRWVTKVLRASLGYENATIRWSILHRRTYIFVNDEVSNQQRKLRWSGGAC